MPTAYTNMELETLMAEGERLLVSLESTQSRPTNPALVATLTEGILADLDAVASELEHRVALFGAHEATLDAAQLMSTNAGETIPLGNPATQ